MKPDRQTLSVDSTLTGEDVAMSIDLSSMPHLMNILTDLYQDRILAIIRELSTNALDSHVDAGNSAPIEVETPGPLRPVFLVRDHGLGLDAGDVHRIISKYGASTKRGDNTAVGMLGLGCKSPLTYTDQFTIVGVKDGVKTTVSVSRDEAGSGNMKILSQEPTDEPNGSTWQVPTKRDDDFEGKAARFFRFWQPGTVLLNGQEPAGLDGFKLSDELTVLPIEQNDWIVQGNVAYPTDLGIYGRQTGKYVDGRYVTGRSALVARVDIGSVGFTPSRESLDESDKTAATIQRIKVEFRKQATDGVQRAVDAAPDKSAALLAYAEATEALPNGYVPDPDTIRYKGALLPTFADEIGATAISSAGYKRSTGRKKIGPAQAATALWIVDYANEHFTGANRNKLEAYMERHGIKNANQPLYITPQDKPQHAAWIPEDNVLSWPDVRKWQPPPDPNATAKVKRVTGSYNAYPDGETYVHETPATDIPQDDTVFWVRSRKYQGQGFLNDLREYVPDGCLVLLPEPRVAKFQRDFPKARELRPFVKAKLEARVKKLTKDERIALTTSGTSIYQKFEDLREGKRKVEDPDLRRVLALCDLIDEADGNLQTDCGRYGVSIPEGRDRVFSVCTKRYPLLGAVSWNAKADDLILYANAAYAAEKE
jgi:hypothetical protein